MPQLINRNSGLTLIELIVTVAIIGILSAIAIPSYNYYTTLTKRSAAKSTLQQIRGLEEQYYTNNKNYTNVFSNLGFQNTPLEVDKTGQETTASNAVYEVTVNLSGNLKYCTSGCTYEVVATAKNTQATNDTKCTVFVYDSLGQKLAYNSQGSSSTDCW